MGETKSEKKESKVAQFFKGVKAEYKKIIWPDRFTVGKQLVAVLVTCVVVGVIIALVDYGSKELINFLMGLG